MMKITDNILKNLKNMRDALVLVNDRSGSFIFIFSINSWLLYTEGKGLHFCCYFCSFFDNLLFEHMHEVKLKLKKSLK